MSPSRCRFLGTSGQNVMDIHKYTSMTNHLDILENTLRLGHLAPTAPDTLGTGSEHPLSVIIIPSLTVQRLQACSHKKL